MSAELRSAVYTVLEGFTLPADARKILESAYWATPAPGAPGQEAAELKPCRHGHIRCLVCMNNRGTPPEAAAEPETSEFIAAYTAVCKGRDADHNEIGLTYFRAGFEAAAVQAVGAKTDAIRMGFLHSGNCDADGYEWGVAKVKFDEFGQVESFLWGAADSSDLDAAIAAALPPSGAGEKTS